MAQPTSGPFFLRAKFAHRAEYLEYTYSETVKVTNGLCKVNSKAARDYLLCLGYDDVTEETIAQQETPVTPPAPPESPMKEGQFPPLAANPQDVIKQGNLRPVNSL